MRKFLILMLVIFSVAFMFSSNNAQADVRETIEVNIRVPVMQKIQVINPLRVNLSKYRTSIESGQPVIIRNAGKIRVLSNSDWTLQVNKYFNKNLRVFIRRSNNPRAKWQYLSKRGSAFSGEQGKRDINFDIKVVAPKKINENQISSLNNKQIQMSFTLTGN